MVTIPKEPEALQRSPFHQSTWTLSPSPVGLSRAIGAPPRSLRSEYPRDLLNHHPTAAGPVEGLDVLQHGISLGHGTPPARAGLLMVLTIASRHHARIRHASHPGPVDGTFPASLHPADVAEPAGAGRRLHSRSWTADRHLGPEHHGAAADDHLHQLPSCAQPEPLVEPHHRPLLAHSFGYGLCAERACGDRRR